MDFLVVLFGLGKHLTGQAVNFSGMTLSVDFFLAAVTRSLISAAQTGNRKYLRAVNVF